MASPSKDLPCSHDPLTSPSQLPPSPRPTNSIDDLLSLERVDSEEDSLFQRSKRNREEGDSFGGDASSQRRRLDSGSRIEENLGIELDDLVRVVDEEGNAIPVGVHVGPLSPFHDSRIIPESVCTPDTLVQLRWVFQIPDSVRLSLPHRGYEVYSPPEGRLLIHRAAFECGVRLDSRTTIKAASL